MTENYNKLIDKEEIANDPYAREHPVEAGCLAHIFMGIGNAIILTATVYGKYLDIKAEVRDRIKQLTNDKDTTSTD